MMLEQIEQAKQRPLARILVALSIRHVGPTAAAAPCHLPLNGLALQGLG